jgi:hypothetical protein
MNNREEGRDRMKGRNKQGNKKEKMNTRIKGEYK